MKNRFVIILVMAFIINKTSYYRLECKSDIQFIDNDTIFYGTGKVDFFQIKSSMNDGIKFAIAINKQKKNSPILLTTSGWYESIYKPNLLTSNTNDNFIMVDVDMRGGNISSGKNNCNGNKLYNSYKYNLNYYNELISDICQVYFRSETGGCVIGYAIIGKFSDPICSAMVACGLGDYKLWFSYNGIGEFGDAMIEWRDFSLDDNKEAYISRSGITTVQNLIYWQAINLNKSRIS